LGVRTVFAVARFAVVSDPLSEVITSLEVGQGLERVLCLGRVRVLDQVRVLDRLAAAVHFMDSAAASVAGEALGAVAAVFEAAGTKIRGPIQKW
jgi:hypothetical protein